MSRCRGCSQVGSESCQCGAEDSDCIDVQGSGAVGDPFVFVPIISAAEGNVLTCTEDGMFAEIPAVLLDPPRGELRRATDQSISSGVHTTITWPVEQWDTDAMHAGSGQVIAVTPGIYDFAGWVRLQLADSVMFLRKNNTPFTQSRDNVAASGDSNSSLSTAHDIDLDIGDVVTLTVIQYSGVPKDVQQGGLSWHYVGPLP